MSCIPFTKRERLQSELNRLNIKLVNENKRLKQMQDSVDGLEYRIKQICREIGDIKDIVEEKA